MGLWENLSTSYQMVALEPDAAKVARPVLKERCAAAMRPSTLTEVEPELTS